MTCFGEVHYHGYLLIQGIVIMKQTNLHILQCDCHNYDFAGSYMPLQSNIGE